MKLLRDVLYKAGIEEVVGNTNLAIERLCFDSRKVDAMSAFVAVGGTASDGHNFIAQAEAGGAAVVVCEELPAMQNSAITYVRVADSAHALGVMASNLYDNPSQRLQLIGVTGTNGKTTVVTLLFQLMRAMGHKCGMLSTVVNRIGNREVTATHTTPDPVQLNALLAEMVNEGCRYCFMEVSSHAVHQKRISGLTFRGGVFTNITHDHLDYHQTFDAYIKAKKAFFDALPVSAFALVNADDSHASVMVQNTKAATYTMAIKRDARFRARIVENGINGLLLSIDDKEVWTKLIGKFNASNLLSAYAVAILLEHDSLEVLTMLSTVNPPAGRFQYVNGARGITGIVDYAHTPDALKNVLTTIADVKTNGAAVITVVGCGGDRDRTKRPLMAAIACAHSDKVVLTSDNPRSEDPEAILSEMQAGLKAADKRKALSITDRRQAIKAAVALAAPGDLVLVAGKGHETYQETKGQRVHFDDLEVLTEMLNSIE